MSKPLTLVTGASGYVGSHCTKVLLENGFNVRGSVKNLENQSGYSFLENFQKDINNNSSLELIQANLLNEADWDKAIEGCDYVLHVASPFPGHTVKKKFEPQIVRPAVEGTMSILKACSKHKVKKVVLTSSVAAILMGNHGKVLTENDWSIQDECGPYHLSKLKAEQVAWSYWEKVDNSFEMTTINPSFIFGPEYHSSHGASEHFIANIMMNKIEGIFDTHYGVSDVREVAQAHYKALINPNSSGKRYIINAGSLWMKDIVSILEEQFAEYGYKLPTKKVSQWQLKVKSLLDDSLLPRFKSQGKQVLFDNSRSIQELGIEYRDIRETLKDTVHSLIEHKVIPDLIHKEEALKH